MKSLFLSMAIVGAITLWYSNAQAHESSPSHGKHYSSHQVQNHARHAGYGYGHSAPDFRHTGWNRRSESCGESRGHGWGSNGAGRDFGHSRHEGWGRSGDNRASRYDPGVNSRQHGQHQRIGQASRSGALTRDERQSLSTEQRGIAAEERQYRSDGRFTRDERKDLHEDLTLASQHIYNESHDADRRQPQH